jgi:hypothetical protein
MANAAVRIDRFRLVFPDPNVLITTYARKKKTMLLLVILLLLLTGTALGGLGLLPAKAAGATTTEGRGQGEVDVLLRVETDDERRDVHDLLADADVALTDQDTGVVDRLGEAELVDASLEAALEEVLDLQGQDVIELHAGLVKDTDAHETANEGVALEQALGVLLVESQELTAAGVSEQARDISGVADRLTGQHDGSSTG